MIRPLRKRHRRIFSALCILLPVTFVIGIAARRSVPVNSTLPATLTGSPENFSQTVWERDAQFTNAAIRIRLRRDPIADGKCAVEITAPENFSRPDTIVYWTASPVAGTAALPTNALLLGSLGATLPLPEAALKTDGALILYSLADGEVVDASKPIHFGNFKNP